VRLWPSPRANGEHTIDVVRRLRAEVHERQLIVLWDGAPDHRANAVREVATTLGIDLMPLPGYSPDLMPVEALWRWRREDVTDHHCHASAEDLTRRGAEFEARLNRDPFVVADRLWVKDHLDPDEEKLRFSNSTRFSADFSVRPEGAYHQWREVPPGELSVCSGSWRAARLGDWLGRSLVTKAALAVEQSGGP
jgi:transposase